MVTSSRALFCRYLPNLDACTYLLVVLVIVPVVVFGLSAVFAVPLWILECDHEDPFIGGSYSYGDVLNYAGADAMPLTDDQQGRFYDHYRDGPSDSCFFYNWFLYVVGNLAALGNPLTNVGPRSGSRMVELLDLLIATWSLAVSGTVIGIAAGLTSMTHLTDRLNGMLRRAAVATDQVIANAPLPTELQHVDIKSHGTRRGGVQGLSFEAFLAVCQRLDPDGIGADEATLRRDFDALAAAGNGALDRTAALLYLRRHVGLVTEPTPEPDAPLLAAVQAMAAEAAAFRADVSAQLRGAVDQLQQQIQSLESRLDQQQQLSPPEVQARLSAVAPARGAAK